MPGTKDTVKNLSNAEDELTHQEAKRFPYGVGKLMYHSLGETPGSSRRALQ